MQRCWKRPYVTIQKVSQIPRNLQGPLLSRHSTAYQAAAVDVNRSKPDRSQECVESIVCAVHDASAMRAPVTVLSNVQINTASPAYPNNPSPQLMKNQPSEPHFAGLCKAHSYKGHYAQHCYFQAELKGLDSREHDRRT
jgi:hypothetical protein